MKNILRVCFFLLLSIEAMGQDNTDIIVGYNNQRYNGLEVGVAHAERDGFYHYNNVHLCGELLFGNAGPSMFGVKAGFDSSFAIFLFSGQAAYYGNSKSSTFLIRPEIGLTVLGFCDLSYGYNLFLAEDSLNIGRNVISFRFKMPLTLMID